MISKFPPFITDSQVCVIPDLTMETRVVTMLVGAGRARPALTKTDQHGREKIRKPTSKKIK